MLTNKDLEKYLDAAGRIVKAISGGAVRVDYKKEDKLLLTNIVAKELILMDKEAGGNECMRSV